jgi:acyl-CoA synthetase (AMP-forming)/AMP-acid ligase II
VETFLLRSPVVRAAAVVGAPDARLGEVVVAFVELADGAAATADDLRAYCKSGMAGYKVPARIVISPGLPLTDTGKVSRRALRESAAEQALSGVQS